MNAKKRFCYHHGITLGLESLCVIYISDAVGFCTQQALPGQRCCALPAHKALADRLQPAQTYRAIRAIDQTKAAYEGAEQQRLKERGKHRFAKCYTPVTFFFVTVCGIVHSFISQYNDEAHVDVLEQFRLTYPTLADQPAYWFFDSMCALHRSIAPANYLGRVNTAGRNHGAYGNILQATVAVVDRFHYHGHAKTDAWCCLFCNPYALNLPGLVEVISHTQVIPAAPSAIAEENGTIGRKFAYRDPVTNKVEHRRMIRQLDSGGSMWEYTVRDQCNSPICEQTFVHFGAFKKQCKSMRACVA